MRSSASAVGRRAVYRRRLVAALVAVCRKVGSLQTTAATKAACDDVARWLRAMPKDPAAPRAKRRL